jgi:hypothetical protein
MKNFKDLPFGTRLTLALAVCALCISAFGGLIYWLALRG